MGAVVLKEGKKIGVANMADGKLAQPSDVIVRVSLAAICLTDVHIKHGGLPGFEPGAILGHELGGVVQEAGAGVPLSGSAIGLRLPPLCGVAPVGRVGPPLCTTVPSYPCIGVAHSCRPWAPMGSYGGGFGFRTLILY